MSNTTATPTSNTESKKPANRGGQNRSTPSRGNGPKPAATKATPPKPIQDLSVLELEGLLTEARKDLHNRKDQGPETVRLLTEIDNYLVLIGNLKTKLAVEDDELRTVSEKQFKIVKTNVATVMTDIGNLQIDVVELKGAAKGIAVAVNNTNKRVNDTNKRVGKLESEFRIHIGALLVGVGISILIWIVASILWGSSNHAPKAVKLADGTPIHQYNAYNELWFVLLFGFLFAVGFMFVYTLVVLVVASLSNSEAPSETEPAPIKVPTFTSDASPKETTDSAYTPTAVMPTATGADSARS